VKRSDKERTWKRTEQKGRKQKGDKNQKRPKITRIIGDGERDLDKKTDITASEKRNRAVKKKGKGKKRGEFRRKLSDFRVKIKAEGGTHELKKQRRGTNDSAVSECGKCAPRRPGIVHRPDPFVEGGWNKLFLQELKSGVCGVSTPKGRHTKRDSSRTVEN